MSHFDKTELPGVSLAIGGNTWKRIDDFEEQGVLYWARPYYHTERDWNRHDISIEGTAKFPAYTIELTPSGEDAWGVRVLVTQGPDDMQPGMSGVLDGTIVETIEAANDQIRAYMTEYNTAHDMDAD